MATHGFIKKGSKVPENEIEKAVNIRKKYFENKHKKKYYGKDSNEIIFTCRNER